jgi:F-type H+-transporting ATPase subunit a
MLNISIAAEKIASIGGFPITNSLLATWVAMLILVVFSLFSTRKMTLVPSSLQSIAEMIVGGIYDFYKSVVGDRIKILFPLLATFFLFIITANWFGLLPGVGTIGFYENKPVVNEISTTAPETSANSKTEPKTEAEFVPLLRGANADINMTLAMAIIAVCAIQYFGFKAAGMHYAKRFINLSNPINFFIGVLEIVSDTSKIISFAFRLFGNIFAGEVLLAVMGFLMPFIAPVPFLTLELFVGFIQALVFSMLAAVFMTVAISEGEHLAHSAEHSHAK